jgi:hypothetical protein
LFSQGKEGDVPHIGSLKSPQLLRQTIFDWKLPQPSLELLRNPHRDHIMLNNKIAVVMLLFVKMFLETAFFVHNRFLAKLYIFVLIIQTLVAYDLLLRYSTHLMIASLNYN